MMTFDSLRQNSSYDKTVMINIKMLLLKAVFYLQLFQHIYYILYMSFRSDKEGFDLPVLRIQCILFTYLASSKSC